MWHFITYEFIYEFMYVKNIVKSYLNLGVSRFQMSAARRSPPPYQAPCRGCPGRARAAEPTSSRAPAADTGPWSESGHAPAAFATSNDPCGGCPALTSAGWILLALACDQRLVDPSPTAASTLGIDGVEILFADQVHSPSAESHSVTVTEVKNHSKEQHYLDPPLNLWKSLANQCVSKFKIHTTPSLTSMKISNHLRKKTVYWIWRLKVHIQESNSFQTDPKMNQTIPFFSETSTNIR